MEIMTWSPGDNGRKPKPVLPQHKFFVSGPPAMNGAMPSTPAPVPAPAPVPQPVAAAVSTPQPAPTKTGPPPNGGGVAPPAGNMSLEDFLKRQGS